MSSVSDILGGGGAGNGTLILGHACISKFAFFLLFIHEPRIRVRMAGRCVTQQTCSSPMIACSQFNCSPCFEVVFASISGHFVLIAERNFCVCYFLPPQEHLSCLPPPPPLMQIFLTRQILFPFPACSREVPVSSGKNVHYCCLPLWRSFLCMKLQGVIVNLVARFE